MNLFFLIKLAAGKLTTPCRLFIFMNYQKFATLYATQLLLGKTINQLCVYQYEANTPNFINLLIAEAEQISKQLGDGYFEDSFWLRAPLNVLDAYKIYERQNIKK